MPKSQNTPNIPLPKAWAEQVRSAVLHVLSLAQYAAVYTRAWAANSVNARVRLKAENDQLTQEVALLREEIRIKDARMARIDPHRRPHYPPTQRMARRDYRSLFTAVHPHDEAALEWFDGDSATAVFDATRAGRRLPLVQ